MVSERAARSIDRTVGFLARGNQRTICSREPAGGASPGACAKAIDYSVTCHCGRRRLLHCSKHHIYRKPYAVCVKSSMAAALATSLQRRRPGPTVSTVWHESHTGPESVFTTLGALVSANGLGASYERKYKGVLKRRHGGGSCKPSVFSARLYVSRR
jgi:hypothetical protein